MTDSPHTNRSTPKPNEAPKAAGIHPPDQSEIMIRVEGLRFQYGQRVALQDLTLSVARGELFGLLGPNGSGKTTFFRILSTALRPAAGTAAIDGHDLVQNPAAARHRLGVAFQSPSLDGKLSVEENLRYHAYLYGMRGAAMRRRTTVLLERFDLDSRRRERVETLSGGLKRRVELAKALLPKPPLLLLDEPSSGLDPAARLEFWKILDEMRSDEGLTVVVATHSMDEAERCDRIALLDRGRLVVVDTPEALKKEIGGGFLTLHANTDAHALAASIGEQMGIQAAVANGRLRLEAADGLAVAARLMEAFSDRIRSITLGGPTLEDVFLAKTGRRLYSDGGAP